MSFTTYKYSSSDCVIRDFLTFVNMHERQFKLILVTLNVCLLMD